jgi:hypothetical protein
MQVCNILKALNIEGIPVAALIPLWVLTCIPRRSMQRLMNVANVVDKKPEMKRVTQVPADRGLTSSQIAFLLTSNGVGGGNGLFSALVILLKAIGLSFEVGNDHIDGPGGVFGLLLYGHLEALIEEGLVDVVKARLIIPSLGLDVIGEGGALNKRVLLFEPCKLGKMRKHMLCFLCDLLIKHIIGHSSD